MADTEEGETKTEKMGAKAGKIAGKGVKKTREIAEATLKQANKAVDEGFKVTKDTLEASGEMVDQGIKRMEETATKNIHRSRTAYASGSRYMDDTIAEMGAMAGRSVRVAKDAFNKSSQGTINNARRMTSGIEHGDAIETFAQIGGEALGTLTRMSRTYVIRAHHAGNRFRQGFNQGRRGGP